MPTSIRGSCNKVSKYLSCNAPLFLPTPLNLHQRLHGNHKHTPTCLSLKKHPTLLLPFPNSPLCVPSLSPWSQSQSRASVRSNIPCSASSQAFLGSTHPPPRQLVTTSHAGASQVDDSLLQAPGLVTAIRQYPLDFFGVGAISWTEISVPLLKCYSRCCIYHECCSCWSYRCIV